MNYFFLYFNFNTNFNTNINMNIFNIKQKNVKNKKINQSCTFDHDHHRLQTFQSCTDFSPTAH